MDRREAIGALEWLRLKAAKPIYSNMHEALDLAIGALQEPITIRKVVLEPTNPETLLEQGMRSLDGLEAELFVKEKHQLSGETPTISEKESVVGDAESATTTDCISRADAIAYIDRIFNSGLGRRKSLDYIRKYISALPPVNQKQITGKLENDENATSESEESTMDQPKSKLDCISREQAIEAMAPFDTNHELRDTLDNLPPVTPTERAGITTDMAYSLHEEIRCEVLCTNPMKSDKGCDGGCQYDTDLLKRIDEVIEKVIVDSPTERTGEWVRRWHLSPDCYQEWQCSECEYEMDGKTNYCPNCGADMRGKGK